MQLRRFVVGPGSASVRQATAAQWEGRSCATTRIGELRQPLA